MTDAPHPVAGQVDGSPKPHVAIVGGGLAGLAATVSLAARGIGVTLLESRPRLGGRASSIVDSESGQAIDNCQHVAMGCCTNFFHFCDSIGCRDLFDKQSELYFIGPPNRAARPRSVPFRSGWLPAPAHLSGSLLRMPWLSWREKWRLGLALRTLARTPDSAGDETFSSWLDRQRQSDNARRCFWDVVLISALSESLDRISVRHARHVFVDGFLTHRDGWKVFIPRVPLEQIYGSHVTEWLQRHDVCLRLKSGVQRLQMGNDRITTAVLRTGEAIEADHFILAVPHDRIAELVPDQLANAECARQLSAIQTAPIASVHLWFDRPITPLPHAVLIGRLSQWLFCRKRPSTDSNSAEPTSHYYQVVISAAHELAGRREADVIAAVVSELKEVWPEARTAVLKQGRLIKEHRAVVSPLPGVDALRPPQQTPIPNLQFAGDWTRTNWPSTMESAVRSGYLAAENILRNLGRSGHLLQPDLPISPLYRLLLGG